MIVSDNDSKEKVFDTYEEANKEDEETMGYAVVNFKIKGKKYYMVTYE